MSRSGNEIAIVGIDLNVPGSKNVDEFWDKLVNGEESIRDVAMKYDLGINQNLKQNNNYVNRVSLCDDYDKFDAKFFGYSSHEASVMDPQQRLFLQCCWKAIEHAGYAPSKINVPVGVFGSAGYNTYLINSISSTPDYIDKKGYYDVHLGNDKDYLATRVSYKMGFTGPSVSVQTACSSSLVGVHLACQSLLMGEADICLAGGSCIKVPCEQGYIYQPDFILSRDGHCRPFDEEGSGTIFGSGVGVVVLKRLEDAIKDQDTIYSIIRSTAINNDGNRKMSFTAPSQEGQEDVIQNALEIENIAPESIRFIEAHGTGTALGDPIEIRAIINMLGLDFVKKDQQYPCAIGSVKSNIGHMDAAAGVVGLIKATLCLYHNMIVPTINFNELNKNIKLDHTRFYIAKECEKIHKQESPICAAVSALGVGGTNAHIIMEEPPKKEHMSDNKLQNYLVKISAKSETSIKRMIENASSLGDRIDFIEAINTLNVGREDFDYRAYLLYEKEGEHYRVCNQSDISKLKELISKEIFVKINKMAEWKILYQNQPIFKNLIDEWFIFYNATGRFLFAEVEEIDESCGEWEIAVKAAFYKSICDLCKDELQVEAPYQQFINGVLSEEELIAQCVRMKCQKDCANQLSCDLKGFYEAIGSLWIEGHEINWDKLYGSNYKNKVSAPVYEFEKNRYWYEEKSVNSIIWLEDKFEVNKVADIYRGKYVFLLQNNSQIDQIELLMNQHQLLDSVYDFELSNIESQSLDLYMKQWIEKHKMNAHNKIRIVVLWEHSNDLSEKKMFFNLIFFLRYLKDGLINCREMSVVIKQLYDEGNKNSARNMLLSGCATSLPREYPGIKTKTIEACPNISEEKLIEEFIANDDESRILLQNTRRYAFKYLKKELQKTKTLLKNSGVYLITGGTGNVGLLFAREILERVAAKVILVSKSYTNDSLQNSDCEKCRSIFQMIQQLRQKGNEIEVVQSDISDFEEASTLIQHVIKKYGRIDGIIHAAGKVGKALDYIDHITPELIEEYNHAKVEGAYHLAHLLKNKHIDFTILLSSTVSILGGVGDSIYSGCNKVINYLAAIEKDKNVFSVVCDYMPRVFKDEYVCESDARFKNLLIDQIKDEEFSTACDYIFGNKEYKLLILSNNEFENRYHKKNSKIENIVSFDDDIAHISLEAVEKKVMIQWRELLENEVNRQHNFFDAGGDSFLAIRLISKLMDIFQIKLSVQYVYEFPTIELMARDIYKRFNKTEDKQVEDHHNEIKNNTKIYVVGMSGKFPGADNIDELWDNLISKKCSISYFDHDECDNFLNAEPDHVINSYVGARGIIGDIDRFDYEFFGISKLEAELMDPQQRLFLEHSWNALEDAGCINLLEKHKVGVFASQGISTYLINVLLPHHKLKTDYNGRAIVNNSPDSLATRVSYTLNLTGVSKTIQTFCSSSLVALEEAVSNIENGKCEIAIVGGVNIVVPQRTGYIYNERSINSHTGQVSPFDNQADGTVFSNGIGVVVLANQSIVDQERLNSYAEVLGVAVNNDGSQKASFSSPSIKGQVECIAEVYEKADINPNQVSYVEAHGTATHIGDPIEVHALTQAYHKFTDQRDYCAIGSIKGSIGHLDRAAGIVGFIKGCLVADRQCIPPLANFLAPNDKINFNETPFYLNRVPVDLQCKEDIYVGVSALGVGGTNAHVLIKNSSKKFENKKSDVKHLFPFSAKHLESLQQYLMSMKSHLLKHSEELNINGMEKTLQLYRRHFAYRKSFVVSDITELIDKMMNAYSMKNKIEKINTLYVRVSATQSTLEKITAKLLEEAYLRNSIPENTIIEELDYKWIIKHGFCSLLQEQVIIIFDDNHDRIDPIFIDERVIIINISENQTLNQNEFNLFPEDVSDLYQIISKIWDSGIDIYWEKLHTAYSGTHIHLPGYSFKKSYCWIEGSQ